MNGCFPMSQRDREGKVVHTFVLVLYGNVTYSKYEKKHKQITLPLKLSIQNVNLQHVEYL